MEWVQFGLGKMEYKDEKDRGNAQWINPENAPNHKSPEQLEGALSLTLSFQRQHQNQTCVDKEEIDADGPQPTDSQMSQVPETGEDGEVTE
jgi:hypothetical protein